MQNARLSQSMRQSFVGLMVLVALGLVGAVVLWLQNFSLGGRSFRATVQFPNAGGMTPGTRVAYRGVRVGQVLSVTPEPAGVTVEIEIWPADRLIPSNSSVEATQAGLVGETSIDITPLQLRPLGQDVAPPLDPDCDPALIICSGTRLTGAGQLDVNTLIRSLLKISNTLSDPEVTASFRDITQNASDALSEIAVLGNELTETVQEARENGILENTLVSVGQAADGIDAFLDTNRGTLAATLVSLKQTSDQIRVTVADLSPILNRVEQGELLDNLEALSFNAAEAFANVRDLTADLNSPTNSLLLQQTLESARSVFENIQKITSDVDEVTGDPEFRQDLMRLIRSLSNLVSSTQQLYQQAQYAQLLPPPALAGTGVNPLAEDFLTPTHPRFSHPQIQLSPTSAATGVNASEEESITPVSPNLSNPSIQLSPASAATGVHSSEEKFLKITNPRFSNQSIQLSPASAATRVNSSEEESLTTDNPRLSHPPIQP